MYSHRVAAAALLVHCALAFAQDDSLLVDDFESGSLESWWVSGSGEYYKGGTDRQALSIIDDAQRGSKVLRAHVRFQDAKQTEICFLTRKFTTPKKLVAYERVSFWYKLTSSAIDPSNGLILRLRVSDTAHANMVVVTRDTVRVGEWVHAEVPLLSRRLRNVYSWLLLPTTQITFRLDDDDATNAVFDFLLDDIRIHPKQAAAADYEPKVSPLPRQERLPKRERMRVLLATQSAAGYYNIEEALESVPERPEIVRSLFRGLHLPLSHFPATRDELFGFAAVVMLDVDPYALTAEQLHWLADYVASGGGLLFVAGPNTLGKAVDFKPLLASMLPTTVPADEPPFAVGWQVRAQPEISVPLGVPRDMGYVRSAYALKEKPGAEVLLASAASKPIHWNRYTGGSGTDGEVFTGPGHESERAAGLRTTGFYHDPKTGKPRFLALALLAGDSDGYVGPNAYPCRPSTTYRLSFWLKGDLPYVQPEALAWGNAAADRAGRQNLPTTLGKVTPTNEWTRHEGTFTTKPDSGKLVIAFRYHQNASDPKLGREILVDELQVVNAESGEALPLKNAGADEVPSVPILTAGVYRGGRVLMLNAFPTASDRGSKSSLFGGPFFDELVGDSVRWLARREPEAMFEQVNLDATEIDRGATATFTARARSVADTSLKLRCVVRKGDLAVVEKTRDLPARGEGPVRVAFGPDANAPAGEYQLTAEVLDLRGRTLARRDATVTLHDPVEARVRFARWNTFDPEQRLQFNVKGTFRGATERYTGHVGTAARLVDPNGDDVMRFGPVKSQVENGVMEEVSFDQPLPNLASGTYSLEAELECLDADKRSVVREEVNIVDPLVRENLFPMMCVSGISGGDQAMDPRRQRERVDELWAHGLNTITADSAEVVAHAARKGMVLFKDYTHLTLCGRDGTSNPCVYAPEHEEALRRRLEGYVALGNGIPRGLSLKVLDEPHVGPGAVYASDYTAAAFEKRFGYAMPKQDELADLPLPKRIDFALFMSDYVGKSYADVRRLCDELGARFDLIVTYDISGFGGAGFRGMQDSYAWSQPAHRIDYDNYIYFYPTSQRIQYVAGHYCYAMIREIARHLKKPWGHYTEIDDRNYPLQVNPVEASSEHTYVALAHGADYVNTFITRAFATGSGARDARWADFGREACKIREVGPLLNKLERPRSEVALYFPAADYYSRRGKPHRPRYAYQLLLRAFGEADIAHEEAVLDEGLPNRKVLVLCDTDVLPDKAATAINAFVKTGGLLLCDHVPQYSDKGESCKLDAALFAGGTETKLGDLATVRSVKYGQGRCLLFGDDLDQLYLDAVETPAPANEKLLRDFVWSALSDAGVKPFARPDDPEFEVGVRAGDDTWLLIAINHADDERTTRISLDKLPFVPAYVVELPSHKPISFAPDQRYLDIALASRHSRMIAFYPSKPGSVKVTAGDATRGKPLTYSVDLRGADGKPCPGRHLVDVTVRDSTGSVRTRFGGRWTTSKGRLERAVEVPVNARRGRWSIGCRLVGTELGAETILNVE